MADLNLATTEKWVIIVKLILINLFIKPINLIVIIILKVI